MTVMKDDIKNYLVNFKQSFSEKNFAQIYEFCNLVENTILNQNNIFEIPNSLTNCRKLRELYLSGAGPILTLPEDLCSLRYFEVLELDRIVTIPNCLLVQQTTRLSIIVR